MTVLAIGLAVAFGTGVDSPAATAALVVAAQAQPPEQGAPPTGAGGRPLAGAFGVRFPDLAPRLGWRPVARRDDVVDGRGVETLVYGRAGRRLAYSIVDGAPVPPPEGAQPVPVRGARAVAFGADGRTAVLTERGGRSVVVSAVGVAPVALVRAARSR